MLHRYRTRTSDFRKVERFKDEWRYHNYFINDAFPPKTFLWSMFRQFFRVKREILNVNGFLKMIFNSKNRFPENKRYGAQNEAFIDEVGGFE